jgi:hypothetical protein
MAEDDWSLIVSRPKGSAQQRVFRKNLAPAVGVRHPDYAFIAYVTFHYVPDDERGFPSPEDADALDEIERVEIPKLEADGLAILVAVVTKNGIKDFLFYTRDRLQFLTLAEKLQEAYPEFQVGCEIASDPEWKHYEDFP